MNRPTHRDSAGSQLPLLPIMIWQLFIWPKMGLLVGYVILEKSFGVYWEFFWCHNIVLISPGEQNIEIDMDKQRVYVTSPLSADELLETIKKAGKTCSYVGVA